MNKLFVNDGFFKIPELLDAKQSRALLRKIKATRSFGTDLFLNEDDYSGVHVKVNPGNGKNNLLETFNSDLGFIEESPLIIDTLDEVLGKDYTIMLKKIVCGVPLSWIPKWVEKYIEDNHVNNLGGFIKAEYRDVTYFRGIDMHQDIIDFKNNPCDFITLYVYLDDVTSNDAPLFVVPGSFKFGAKVFPHNIKQISNDRCVYEGDELPVLKLTGLAGSVAFWHSCTLHGTQPSKTDSERISLRYLIKKGRDGCLIDTINDSISGSLNLQITRDDVDKCGVATKKGNFINNV